MAQSEKELEKQLLESGNSLLSPPSSVTELLTLLDRVENALARVEQSPSESMKKALSPSMKALISDVLMKHSDANVNVSVASCISEITRITAPDAPYEDDQMKEVFKLIVSSFEKLDDKASPSYVKRTAILETVAKVRSCVVMLDLECDDLIAEMFGHFFKSIRDDHPENVFSSMETIMVLVVEESEDISPDLLSTILDVLKLENRGVLPIARQLGEKVVEKCASKLKPYLLHAVKSQCRCLDDYSKVVANVCQTGQEALEPTDGDTASRNVVGENDVANVPPEKAVEVAMETLVDAPPSEEVGPVGSPKSIMSNGTLQKETDDSTAGNTQSKEACNENSEAKGDDEPEKTEVEPTETDAEPTEADAEPAKTDVEEPIESQSMPDKSSKNKGSETSALKGSSEPSELSEADGEKEAKKEPDDQEKDCKEVDSGKIEEPVPDATGSKEKEKEADTSVSSQKMSDNVGGDVSSPSSENLADESRSEKIEPEKKKDDSVHLNETEGDGDTKKESNVKNTSEGTGASETKSQKRSAKKTSSVSEKEDEILDDVDAMNKEDEAMEVDAIPAKKSSKKVETDSSQREDKKSKDATKDADVKSAKKSGKKVEIDSSQREDKNKGQVKGTSTKDVAKTPSKSSGKKITPKASGTSTKDESDAEKSVKTSSKRKRSPDEEKASKTKEYGAELIGTKVKVWWPHDKAYYEGVVDSFDAAKKKHTILYNDGDIETLKLSKEKWEIVSDERCADEVNSLDEDEEFAETPKAKKVKAGAGQTSKQGGKSGNSSKKGDVSSGKSKATPKSGLKKKDDSKSDGKSKVESSKGGGKVVEEKGGKSKDTKSGKKSSDETPKSTAKPKSGKKAASSSDDDDDDDAEKIIKGGKKSKQDTPKVAAKSKSKSSKSGTKSSTNGSGKVKVMVKDSEDSDSDSDMAAEPAKTSEATKGNSSSSKSQKSQSAKKRKRS